MRLAYRQCRCGHWASQHQVGSWTGGLTCWGCRADLRESYVHPFAERDRWAPWVDGVSWFAVLATAVVLIGWWMRR